MNVPFLDLKQQYMSIRDEVLSSLGDVMEHTAFSGGRWVEEFETAFASYCGCLHAVGVGSGTDALWLTMLAMGIGPGDEVITVPNTFIATAEAISYTGARPVFVDVDERTYTMDPSRLEDAVTVRTRAVIPVHLYGHPADMEPIMDVAGRHGLHVIEDACQAHGALYRGLRAGSIGHAGCFSFYPGKNLGAYGEAGAIVTSDSFLADRLITLRDHGQREKYHHELIGWNARMDGFQGAVLSVKLPRLEEWNSARRRHARRYNEILRDVDGVVTPVEAESCRHVHHIYAVRVRNPIQIMDRMKERGIVCLRHYPVPVHLQQAYRWLGYGEGSFPVAERCAREEVSLPMYPEMEAGMTEHVAMNLAEMVVKADAAEIINN